MSRKLLIGMLMFLMVFSVTVKAEGYDIQMELHKIIAQKWEVNNLIAEDSSYIEKYMLLSKEVEKFLDEMIEFYRNNDIDSIKILVKEFEKLDVDSKNFVYSQIISVLKEYEAIRGGEQYLPGYGYTDSDYSYKLGKEVKSEFSQSYWKKEKRRIENGKTYKFYVKMEISGEIGANIGASANVAAFKITGEAHFKVNGKLEKFSEVEMITKETVETETLLLYEKRQVWFEVYKTKKDTSNWVKDGTCYLYKEFPSNTEIILEPGQVF
ncbi:MAG: hypothetical protein M0R46_09300 [Candidatus Muirbacterium halophilum]|nr:hypothetical protein [Candidatus Muirbacterium halophilum]MCK9476103.1 hypothetical protein [Candidatus Muirbacterium halophilum]